MHRDCVLTDDARDYSDTCAERIRALHGVPVVATATVAKNTTLPPYPEGLVDTAQAVDLIVERLDLTAASMRKVYDAVDAEDGATSSLLADWIWKLEKYAWLVGAENMTPNNG